MPNGRMTRPIGSSNTTSTAISTAAATTEEVCASGMKTRKGCCESRTNLNAAARSTPTPAWLSSSPPSSIWRVEGTDWFKIGRTKSDDAAAYVQRSANTWNPQQVDFVGAVRTWQLMEHAAHRAFSENRKQGSEWFHLTGHDQERAVEMFSSLERFRELAADHDGYCAMMRALNWDLRLVELAGHNATDQFNDWIYGSSPVDAKRMGDAVRQDTSSKSVKTKASFSTSKRFRAIGRALLETRRIEQEKMWRTA